MTSDGHFIPAITPEEMAELDQIERDSRMWAGWEDGIEMTDECCDW